jgi:mono/diheme cytochrome c family protein
MKFWGNLAMATLFFGVVTAPAVAADAAKAPNGKPVFTKYKCSSCHSIEAQAIVKKADPAEKAAEPGEKEDRKAPDLSGVGVKRNAAWIEAYLLKKEMIEARKHTKKFRGTDPELKTVAGWLASMKDEKAAAKQELNEKANEKAAESAKSAD